MLSSLRLYHHPHFIPMSLLDLIRWNCQSFFQDVRMIWRTEPSFSFSNRSPVVSYNVMVRLPFFDIVLTSAPELGYTMYSICSHGRGWRH
ncbi:hypothetical protein K439DRAFT_20363 [Ramaria rubella]|nr:hypothetical protein K439DRAFT_20363 [Ramaria rubella]